MASVAAIVLAAGLSSRMAPANKLLAVLPDGRPMIARTVDNVLTAGACPVLVVTGHQGEGIRAALTGRNLRFVLAPDFANGMAASLRAGIAALPEDAAAALICLGDMPLVAPATLQDIIAAFDPAAGREIVLPTHQGRRGNPVLWGRRLFPALLNLEGDAGARQILHHYREWLVEVPVGSDSVLRDFDTPESFSALAAM